MTRIAIDSVTLADGPLFMERDWEDGPRETYRISVVASVGADEYVLIEPLYRPSRRQDAEDLADAVRAKGTIDPAYWTKLEPRASLEERFDAYANAEAEMRVGMRQEDDYHGCP